MLAVRLETQPDLLAAARAAYREGDWENSYAAFSRAGAVGPLSLDDLDAMAVAAWRLGHGREAVRVAEMVYVRLVRTDPGAAAAKAVELGSAWLARGDVAVGQSWISRARGLLGSAPDGPAVVRLTYLETVVAVLTDHAEGVAERSAALRGVSRPFDAAVEGEPVEAAARRARGEAFYELGEVRRRRGDVDGAFAAYARARELGVDPQPGEALLRCARGDVDSAREHVQAALAEADPRHRLRLIRGAAEIALAAGDLDAVAGYLRELDEAGSPDVVLRGALLACRGHYRDATVALRAALRDPRVNGVEYEVAEVYRWMAVAHRGLGARLG
ncbi:hypothetical protein [Mycobacterium sp. M26]|uniref:tetratricopeptide repeat protein n=1 Tax=Mycobacterium sp. M26 TaxID=1762962 RepID=UPI00073E5B74|nr:hypothetical protein [Mycobacterium sp. M26]